MNKASKGLNENETEASTVQESEKTQPAGKSLKSTVDRVRLRLKVASVLGGALQKEEDDKDIAREKEFHAVFHAKQNQEEDPLLQNENDEENMWDIVDMDEEAIEEYASNELVGQFLSNKMFRTGILGIILFNSLLIVVETNEELEKEYNHLFSVLDQCLMTIFVCEILLKWYHGFFMFWKMGWNVLDFFIVASLLLGPLLSKDSGSRGVLRILRVLRAFRSLRSISSLPGLQIVVQTILQSIPDMANIVLLLVIIMLVFSVIGITLFRDTVPKYFGSLSTAMFTLFVCLTQDGWMEIFGAFQSQGDTTYIGGGIFLLVFIAIGAFVFANLVVAVVVTNLEFAMVAVKNEGKEREADDLKSKLEAENDLVNIVSPDDIPACIFNKQMPYQVPEFKNLPIDQLENYITVIFALENNLAEYKKIKAGIVEIFSEVSELQEKAKKEGILKEGGDSHNLPSQGQLPMSGDVISNLMEMESGRVFDSHKDTLSTMLKEGAKRVKHGSRRSSQRSAGLPTTPFSGIFIFNWIHHHVHPSQGLH
ncbi:cation channel sperm-associated protein 4-like [Actinia tenebrosa]|uniref:Cation channel sperm-associated protein 4-like n=1 Tax=Actinia tenebrosa TaxID=6105 RepID=A0A6P8IW11_ACTTE|nr:cation channel sperm-associated protein 4-like [Actinia tenebrosa]